MQLTDKRAKGKYFKSLHSSSERAKSNSNCWMGKAGLRTVCLSLCMINTYFVQYSLDILQYVSASISFTCKTHIGLKKIISYSYFPTKFNIFLSIGFFSLYLMVVYTKFLVIPFLKNTFKVFSPTLEFEYWW